MISTIIKYFLSAVFYQFRKLRVLFSGGNCLLVAGEYTLQGNEKFINQFIFCTAADTRREPASVSGRTVADAEDGNSHMIQELLLQMWTYPTGGNVWCAVRHRFHLSMYLQISPFNVFTKILGRIWGPGVEKSLLLQVLQLSAFVKMQQRRHCTVWRRGFCVPPEICSIACGRYKAASAVKIGVFSGNRNT